VEKWRLLDRVEVEPAAAADAGKRSFECNSAASLWLADLEPALGLRRVIYPRTPALPLQTSVRLRPRRRLAGILNPMGHRGLVAPIREPRHDPAMHARLHKGAHGHLVTPHGAGPESAIGVTKDGNARFPVARLAWRAARKDWIRNPGKYRQDRTRSRVMDTRGIA
jgi:hypothetical protein